MAETDTREATLNSISGNAIHGGKITLLRSTGIRDLTTRTLLVEDDPTVGTVDTDNILGDLFIENDPTVGGEIKADRITVKETVHRTKTHISIRFSS